jgi:hypothetical protein
MALFTKRSKMEKLQAVVTALRERGELLDLKRTAAQSAFDAAVEARQSHLLTGDIDNTSINQKLQAKVDTASSTLMGLDSAIAALQAQMNDAEAQLDAERQVVERKAASEQIAANVANIDKLLGPWLAASREIAAAMETLHWRYESKEMAAFIRRCANEVELASSFAANDLNSMAAAIAAGHMPIPPESEVFELVPAPEPEAVMQVFLLSAVKFTDASGVLHHAGKWTDCEMPPACAERALRHKKAVPLNDHRRSTLKGSGGGHPEKSWCFDLDHEPAAEPGHDPILHSAFSEPTIGKPYIVQTAGNRF